MPPGEAQWWWQLDGSGGAPFIPTDDQRNFVEGMAGIKMTWDEIASLIINPRTGDPINKSTLAKAFKRELAVGKAKHKSLIAGGITRR